MDILKILEESTDSLILEDLECFEAELDTGSYDDDYIRICKSKISSLKAWMKNDNKRSNKLTESTKFEKKVEIDSPVILNLNNSNLEPCELLKRDLKRIRKCTDYKKRFKEFIRGYDFVDVDFIDNNISFFEVWELSSMLSFIQMGEPFLEKYFGALDLEKVARYQEFSEQFFMKHFSQLDATIVLTKGKNAWRKKENRSKQLDVFLRLKGIKL